MGFINLKSHYESMKVPVNQPVSWNGTVGFWNTVQLCHERVWIFLQDEPLLVISTVK